MINRVKAFIDGPERNAWLTDGTLQVYVRNARRLSGSGRLVQTLDLANIVVAATRRDRGVFRTFLADLEQLLDQKKHILYVENVLTERFAAFFRARGYIEEGSPTPSFWRVPKD